jgi:type IV pilus assembly protein PilE
MRKSSQPLRPDGFSLIELMVVVAILSVLVSIAAVSYHLFVTKARVVEGEIVIREVERLEHLYHASNHTYTDNLTDLNFAIAGGLRYYTPEVRMGNTATGVNYQVRALPNRGSSVDGWLLTSYKDGSIRIDRGSVIDLTSFASARYWGNSTGMTSGEAGSISQSGGLPGGNEPEWSGLGSSLRCQECGRVIVHRRE